jgi:uncharacterized lipoprotein NlpE involved in copper resistance
MKKLLLPLFFVGILTSCNRNSNDVQVIYDTIDSDTSLMPSAQSLGIIYQGILPCNNCSGINTMLTIIEDTTYALSETYQGAISKDSSVNASGKLNKITGTASDRQALVYELVPYSGQTSRYFKILGDTCLQVLDVEKKEFNSSENLLLRKQ